MTLEQLALRLTATVLAGALAWARPAPVGSAQDPLQALERWTEEVVRRTRPLDGTREDELRSILAETRGLARASFEGQRSVLVALLDLYAAGIRLGDSLDDERVAGGVRLRELAELEVRRWTDEPAVRWLARKVLVSPQHPPNRRAACALVLAGTRDDALLLALSTCARENDGVVREAALWALAGWDEESVHAMFVRLLGQENLAEPGPALGALERHFRRTRLAADSPLAPRLLSHVVAHIGDENWRVAAHAIGVSSALDTSLVAPVLIGALELWVQRAEAGEPVRRVHHDLVRALQERAGLRLGPRPERWRTWWKGYEAGQRPVSEVDPDTPVTEVSFFGIRPLTDRVVFLIDHSGSMASTMPATGGRSSAEDWTRYREAVAQMVALLESMGPRTRFNVITFDDEPKGWHRDLRAATAGNVRSARNWLLARRPEGATLLRPAVELALGIGRDGSFDPAEIEADTLVVLCDGQTTEGPAWIRPLFERVQVRSRWLVHSVQLGSFGDTSLELLAELTAGDHVRIEALR